jgi:hypothetical protein
MKYDINLETHRRPALSTFRIGNVSLAQRNAAGLNAAKDQDNEPLRCTVSGDDWNIGETQDSRLGVIDASY